MGRMYVALTWLLRSRYYAPLISALIVVLVLAVGVQLAARGFFAGWLDDTQGQGGITIVGASTNDDTPAMEVAILGAVTLPGLYAVPVGSRVYQVVDAAGGALPEADLARVTLAAEAHDGQTIYVPQVGEPMPTVVNGRVNINQADVSELRQLLGLSTDVAQRIVGYRVAHGPFTAVSQLLLVPVSLATYNRIKDLVTI